jgi:biopolymer transport protein ExbD
MVRLAADGAAHLEGRRLDAAGLARTLAARLAARPGTAVVVLASPRADMQALVGVIDAARAAGAARLSVVRLEGRP